jgi:hypothetical protein
MAGTLLACKDASSLWVLEPLLYVSRSWGHFKTAHGSDLHLFPGPCSGSVGFDEGLIKTRCQRS